MIKASTMMKVASRGLARCAHLSHGKKLSLPGQQAARGLSSTFKPTTELRKAAVPSLDDEGPAAKVDPSCVINSHTEWDPLEEVIVGRIDGATIPEWHVAGKAVWPAKHWDMYKNKAGQSFPEELMRKGERERERER